MVVIKRISTKKVIEEEQPIKSENFELLTLYFELPTEDPKSEPVSARPYSFDDAGRSASSLATTCPHCGQGNFININNIKELNGVKFVGCSECKEGVPIEVPEFIDPFQNPIKNNKIGIEDLDPDLATQSIDMTKNVSEKLQEAIVDVGISEAQESDSDATKAKEEGDEYTPEEENIYEDADDPLESLDDESMKLLGMLEQEDDEV